MPNAKIKNPRKKFLFQVTFIKHPINSYLFQSVDLPEKSVEVVEHGDINRSVKTGGRVVTGNCTMNKLETTSGSDTWLFDWLSSVQDDLLGGGLTPMDYWETIKVDELAEDGRSVINSWILDEAFPVKLNGQNLDRMSSDNTIETLELAVGTCQKF